MSRDASPTYLAALFALLIISACSAPAQLASTADTQVLFVCEHGNVKSLMATSYFNQLAKTRGLPYRAVSRGVAPDSTTVPLAIVAGLQSEGFDVAAFHPVAVDAADVAASRRVILINSTLPENLPVAATERWTDVPAASVDYAAASAALKRHVESLIDDMQHSNAQ
jgi:arsenate reductase (thioredoxin)